MCNKKKTITLTLKSKLPKTYPFCSPGQFWTIDKGKFSTDLYSQCFKISELGLIEICGLACSTWFAHNNSRNSFLCFIHMKSPDQFQTDIFLKQQFEAIHYSAKMSQYPEKMVLLTFPFKLCLVCTSEPKTVIYF